MGSKNIQFKSIPLYYKKEFQGLKRNTVRDVKIPDIRQEVLMDYHKGRINDLTITLINIESKEEFTRQVTDVTFFKDLWIISWWLRLIAVIGNQNDKK